MIDFMQSISFGTCNQSLLRDCSEWDKIHFVQSLFFVIRERRGWSRILENQPLQGVDDRLVEQPDKADLTALDNGQFYLGIDFLHFKECLPKSAENAVYVSALCGDHNSPVQKHG
jgi:hypothetical protein